jgi:hypothetical protein
MSKSRSRSAQSGKYVTADEAAANPSTTVQERTRKRTPLIAPLTDEETMELTQVLENAGDVDQVVDYVNKLIAKRG